MTSPSFLQAYPELLLSAMLFIIFFVYRRARLSSSSLVGILPSLFANLHRFHDWLTDLLSDSNGTFHFLGPLSGMDYVLTSDPANANHILNINFSNYPKGENFSETFDILGNGIFVADGDSWKSQRHKAQIHISDSHFRLFMVESALNKVEKGLLPFLTLMAKQEKVVDLQDVMLRLTFDLTCHLVLGVDPGCLAVGFPTIGFATAIDDAMEALFIRHVVPPGWWRLMRWMGVGEEKKLAWAWKEIDDFIVKIIREKRESNNSDPDLLKSYMNGGYSSEDDKFLRDTTLNLMLAGRDTTGAALAWLFWILAENPDLEKRVVDELKDCCFMSGSSMELGKLVYLHAVLCETLRLFPPVPLERKCVVRPDVLPSGARLRPGTKILLSVYAMGRMEGVWGKDCMEFKPERWISEQGKLRHEASYKFLAFNSGPRTCLGRNIAFAQMKAVAAAVMYNFHVEVVKGHVVEPKLSIILHMKNGLMVRLKKRVHG